MIQGSVDYIQRNREKVTLVGYFALMLALTPMLARFLGGAWETGHVVREAIDARLMVGVSLEAVSVLFLGLFVGFLVLMTIDPKKRWQAYLLWLGLAIALLGLRSMDLFIPNIDFLENVVWLLGGLVLGLVLGGGRKLLETQTAEALEFRRASRGIFFTLVLLIVGAFVEYHLVYPEFLAVSSSGVELLTVESTSVSVDRDGLVRNAVISSIFIVTVKRFVQYDSEEDFFVLGPRASGKSLFLIGSYLAALNRDRSKEATKQTPMQPSQDLMEMVEELDRQTSEWIVEATGRGDVEDLAFQYVHGSVFPKNVKVSSIDYAGEYLSRLPDALTGAIDEDDGDNTLSRLAEGVEDADTLILILDVERFIDDEPLEISEYFSILQAAGNKGVLLVATKADVLADDFRDERAIEAHLAFDEFSEYVERRLRQSEQVDSLLRETASAKIHPVYYQTTTNEDGDRVPMRDDAGSVMTIGFDRLLETLGR